MEPLKTAEATTKLLRSKDVGVVRAVDVSTQLLDGNLDVFLINKHHFVFDLVCDRMNEFIGKNFKNWKLTPSLWSLWDRVWHTMDHSSSDRAARAKSFRKVKYIQVITAVVDAVGDNSNDPAYTGLLSAMFHFTSTVLRLGYIDVEEFAATGFLASYAKCLNNMSYKEEMNQWTESVDKIFGLPKHSVTYKPTKKSTIRYFSEALPELLCFLSSTSSSSTTDTLQRINRTVLFGNETKAASLVAHTDDLLSSGKPLLVHSIDYFFDEIINHLAAKNLEACEAIYLKITHHADYAAHAELLLAVLAKVNRALSPELFVRIYENANTKSPKPWRLIGYLVRLDPHLATQRALEIIAATAELDEPTVTFLADDLAHGFMKGRNLVSFISEHYPVAVKTNIAWASASVISALSLKLPDLSGNQFLLLARQFVDVGLDKVVVLLLRGLLLCSYDKQDAVKPLIDSDAFASPQWPEALYCLLCIYGDEVLEKHPGLIKEVTARKTSSKYDYYVLFRLVELTADLLLADASLFTNAVASFAESDLEEFATRWLVLLDHYKDAHENFLNALFKLPTDRIVHLIEGNTNVVMELPGLLSSLATYMSSATVSTETRNRILILLPLPVYRRFFAHFTESLCQESLEDVLTREVLLHILQQPTFSCVIEKDFKFLIKFLDTDSSLVSLEIASAVWNSHISHFKDKSSKEYVLGALKYLLKKIGSSKVGKILSICHVVLQGSLVKNDEDFSSLHRQLCEAFVEKSANNTLDLPTLQALAGLPEPLSQKVKKDLLKVTSHYNTKTSDLQSQALLFCIITKAASESLPKHALHVVTLYVVLGVQGAFLQYGKSLQAALKSYLARLSQELFADLHSLVIESAQEGDVDYSATLVGVLLIMTNMASKGEFLVRTLLLMISRMGDFANDTATLLSHVDNIANLTKYKPKVFSQHAIEQVVDLADSLITETAVSDEVFSAAVNLVAHVVLFHRYRFNSRYHLLLGVVSGMVHILSKPQLLDTSAAHLARLLIALCEPSVQSTGKDADSLTSQAAIYKRMLRKHAHVLLINYVHAQVEQAFSSDKTDAVMPGIFSVFGLLSQSELQLVSQLLELHSRFYYRTLYNKYKDQGKWRDV